MPIQPRTEDEIYEQLSTDLASSTDAMTNFVEGSFNDQFVRAYAQQIRQLELKALAAELSGYIDFAGREVTAEDLDQIGIENVEPDELNQYISDVQLDAVASNVGVTRDDGVRATGSVTFQVSDDTVSIPQGYIVSTDPSSAISGLEFRVDPNGDGNVEFDNTVTATPETGETSVTVDVVADEPGTPYNLGPGSVEYLPNPKPGVQSVTNTVSMSGGEDPQSNGELRQAAKGALFDSSEGGTKSGIESYILRTAESDVESVSIDEFTDVQPTYVDVVVDGGDDTELKTLIKESKPWGIEHKLVRPAIQSTGIHTNLLGTNTDETLVRDTVVTFFENFTIGDQFYLTELLNNVSFADDGINSVPVLNTYHNIIENESYTYDSSQSVYELEYGPFGRVRDEEHYVTDGNTYSPVFTDIVANSVTVEVITDDIRQSVDSANITVSDSSGDGKNDTISLADTVSVDNGTVVTIGYDHNDWAFDNVSLPDGTTYEQGVDYELIDNDGDGLKESVSWLSNATPTDGARFTVSYRPYRSFTGDLVVGDRSKMGVDGSSIDIRSIES